MLGQWFAAHGPATEEALALDGKTLRSIHGEEIPDVHLVAAYAHQTRVVLAQAETVGNGHELVGAQAVLAAQPRRSWVCRENEKTLVRGSAGLTGQP